MVSPSVSRTAMSLGRYSFTAPHLQHLVDGQVRDAEPAHAQHPPDAELVVEQRLRVERERTAIGGIARKNVVALHVPGIGETKERRN
jgi:hypothetical protein